MQTRRAAMGVLAGVAAMAAGVAPSQAAYGDAANVFGKVTNKSGRCPLEQALNKKQPVILSQKRRSLYQIQSQRYSFRMA